MHATDKPNTTANPNAEGDDLGQVGGKAKNHFGLRTTSPNGSRNVEVSATGIRKNERNDMPEYVRLAMEYYPLVAQNIMTPAEARTLAKFLMKAADFADSKD